MYKAIGITLSGEQYTANARTPQDAFAKLLKKHSEYAHIIITRISVADIRQGRE